MDLLENVVQPYAWGSRTAIARLQGRPEPSPGPEAELWMGAHPQAPSRLIRAGVPLTLISAIQAAPERELGPDIARAFGGTLPFLLKVLAAETPLSLQAHPSLDQAQEGFARENALGIPLTAPQRNYKDANHKPELLCALTAFDALCGFRDVRETIALFGSLGVPELDPLLRPLRASPDAFGLRRTFEILMTSPAEQRAPWVARVARAARERAEGSRFRRELEWAARLETLYPGDPGVVGTLLLNLVQLAPGEAIYLPAGNLHAYLHGVGVEIMANSDNVLRGGCTPKHVDAPELLRVLNFSTGPIAPIHPLRSKDGDEVYPTPAREFRLSRASVTPADTFAPARRGPELLLCTAGALEIQAGKGDALHLRSGQSVFVSASDPAYRVRGDGVLFRATAGDLESGGE
ncbi:MAG: mannose-6-phosphate isomerase, class I [Myxococcaceae bacterium]|nr:mannose-6-phosphate isomerase, class I [Myxococcaceae bacterium]